MPEYSRGISKQTTELPVAFSLIENTPDYLAQLAEIDFANGLKLKFGRFNRLVSNTLSRMQNSLNAYADIYQGKACFIFKQNAMTNKSNAIFIF